MSTLDEPLHLPPQLPQPRPPAFPVLACIAPLVAAALIWLITQSTFALLFAVLSPVIAVASLGDGRRATRRQRAANSAERAAALGTLQQAVRERHDVLRQEAWRRQPGGVAILGECGTAALWRPGGDAFVSLGTGRIPSGLRLGGAVGPADERALRDWAAELSDAPVSTDAAAGIGLVGPVVLTRALARSLLVQLCFALPPGLCHVAELPGTAWEWALELPHTTAARPGPPGARTEPGTRPACRVVVCECPAPRRGAGTSPGREHAAPGAARMMLALAETDAALPPGCGTVVQVRGPMQAWIVRSPGTRAGLCFRPELVAAEQAHPFARLLSERAAAAGLVHPRNALPDVVAFGDLHPPDGVAPDATPAGRTLAGSALAGSALAGSAAQAASHVNAALDCVIGIGADGPMRIDLVRQGPHSVVGGTTGSGKSELLVTWVADMARCRSVTEVTFLLVDFKGGAAFAPLLVLPHCVGMITDLDAVGAERALASLGAELRFRESALRDAGVRDLAQAAALGIPRLVIVVDEFATMLQSFPELHALFVDIAARGRSLGVHLILCTQRPAGVVRDSLLANCSLRLSLRVNNRADSEAVIGTDAAAALSPSLPGRCLISGGEGEPQSCQVATTTAVDIRGIARTAAPAAAPRRPWLAPLPPRLTLRDVCLGDDIEPVPTGSLILGLIDEPDRQRYRVARHDPQHDGHLIVIGDARTGKSTLLSTLARQSHPGQVLRAAADPEVLWDLLECVATLIDARTGQPATAHTAHRGQSGMLPLLVLIDDLDAVMARWGTEHQLAALDLFTLILRDGPAAAISVVFTVQRLTGTMRALAALCPNRLLLGLRDRDDHRAAGGPPALFAAHPRPGSGCLDGYRLQLLAPASDPVVAPVVAPVAAPEAGLVAASGRHGLAPAQAVPAGPNQTPATDPAPPVDLPALAAQGPVMVVTTSRRTTARIQTALGAVTEVVQLTGVPVSAAAPSTLTVNVSGGPVFVGDVDSWQAQWALLAALRPHATVLFDGCSLADYRLLSRRRELPPPLSTAQSRVWLLTPDGSVTRARLP